MKIRNYIYLGVMCMVLTACGAKTEPETIQQPSEVTPLPTESAEVEELAVGKAAEGEELAESAEATPLPRETVQPSPAPDLKITPDMLADDVKTRINWGLLYGEIAPRYFGEGYSVLIPKDGWNRESFETDGYIHDTWSSGDGSCVFEVIHLGDMEVKDAFSMVQKLYLTYTFEESFAGNDYWNGTEDATGSRIGLTIASLCNTDTFAVLQKFSQDAPEEAVNLLHSIDYSFVLEGVKTPVTSFSYADLENSVFCFSSGAGGWGNYLCIEADGSFYGTYEDWNMGHIYQCRYRGQFSEPVKVNDYTWKAYPESIVYEKEPGTEEQLDDILYTYTEPYGFESMSEVLFYLPGAPAEELPEGFLNWANGPKASYDRIVGSMTCYGMYNAAGEYGFVDCANWENADGMSLVERFEREGYKAVLPAMN